jgi:hypothetical protein
MVAAIVILYLLAILVGCLAFAVFLDCCDLDKRLGQLKQDIIKLSEHISELHSAVKGAHAHLVDDLWQRASQEVDQEIEKARTRGRDY